MDADTSNIKVRRGPQWRSDRVIELLGNPRLQPRRSDDPYVRWYRRYRLLEMAAGCHEVERFDAFLAHPHSCLADSIYFGPDMEFKHILEARLLSDESPAAIASRLKIDEETINHFEALFFDFRSRPRDTDWVQEVIVGPPEGLAPKLHGVMSETQRGFLYRLFAYCGGPTVLDSVIFNVGPPMTPQSYESVDSWLDSAAEQVVQSLSDAANPVRPIQDTVVRLLELGLEPPRKARMRKAARKLPPSDFEVFATAIIARISGQSTSKSEAPRQRARTAANSRSREPAVGSEWTA